MNQANLLRSPRLALAPAEEGYFAYDLQSRELHRLNATAGLVLELADGKHTASGICDELAPLLGEVADTCDEWTQFAMARGWLMSTSEGVTSLELPRSEVFSTAAVKLRSDGNVLAAYVCQEYATALQSDSAKEWCTLGELAHITGRRERAREAYETYLTICPDDAEVEFIARALRDEPPPIRAPDECIEQLYSRFANFYEKNMCGDLDYQAPLRIKELLQKFPGDGAAVSILGLGCGTGLLGQHLRPYASHLMGIDLSQDMAAQAGKTGLYDELEVAEITAWFAQTSRTYDVIIACDTLIYFGDLQQVIVPAAAHLQSNGRFAFTVEKGDVSPFGLTDSGRYSHTEEHIRAVARDAGFTVVSLEAGFLRNEYGKPVIGLVVLLQLI